MFTQNKKTQSQIKKCKYNAFVLLKPDIDAFNANEKKKKERAELDKFIYEYYCGENK